MCFPAQSTLPLPRICCFPQPPAALDAARSAAASPASDALEALGDGPAFQPVAISFRDLRYYVPHPKEKGAELELLKGVTGSFVPGKLVALVSLVY